MVKNTYKISVLAWLALLLIAFGCESKKEDSARAYNSLKSRHDSVFGDAFKARAEAKEKSGKAYRDSSDIRVENSFDMSKFKGEDSIKAHAVKEQIKKQFREMYK